MARENWDMRGSLLAGTSQHYLGEALRAEPLLAVGAWFQVWEREVTSGLTMFYNR